MTPPHALALPLPAQGHINPLMQLCEQLADIGFIITFVNTRTVHEQMLRVHRASPSSDKFTFVSVPDDMFPQEDILANLQTFLAAARDTMKPEVERIIRHLPSPVTCIIADPFFDWTHELASELGICKVCFWTSSAMFALLVHHLPELRRQGVLEGEKQEQTIELSNLPSIPTDYLPPSLKTFGRKSMSLDKRDAWVLVNSFYEVEKEQFDQLKQVVSPNVVPVGPCIPLNGTRLHSVWQEETSCMQWLDEQLPNSVIYISFGSLATLSSYDIVELAAGLEQSECNFLWVVRSDVRESDVLHRLSLSRRGRIVPWAPQMKVLEHEAVAAFLTHCGWNSLMEAVAGGVPVLGWPCFAEQKLNCMFAAEEWKVGFPAYSTSIATASEISRTVKKIMGEEGVQVRKRMKALRALCLGAVKGGGSSNMNLQAFLEDMQTRAENLVSVQS